MREAWRNDGFSQDVESRVLDMFGSILTRADHKARMDRRLYEKDDTEAALRAAARLGGNEPLIAKARIADADKGGNKAALDAVPAAARDDIGYKFARIQMLRRADKLAEAVALIKTVAEARPQPRSRRMVDRAPRAGAQAARRRTNPKDAYAVVRDATPPDRDNYRAEQQFMAGWIALRFLHDPATAYAAFRQDRGGSDNPISLARGAYWTGPRGGSDAQDAGGARSATRRPRAIRPPITARSPAPRLGLRRACAQSVPDLSSADRGKAMSSEVVRAAELLYAIDARDLAWTDDGRSRRQVDRYRPCWS